MTTVSLIRETTVAGAHLGFLEGRALTLKCTNVQTKTYKLKKRKCTWGSLWNIEKYFIDLLTPFQIFEDLQIKKNDQYFMHIIPYLLIKNKSWWSSFWCCTVIVGVPQMKFLVNLFNGEITFQYHFTNLCNLVKQRS